MIHDLGGHVRREHPDDKFDLVGKGTALMQDLFNSKLKEFNKMDSQTVADFQEVSKGEPTRKIPQRAEASFTPDIVPLISYFSLKPVCDPTFCIPIT